MNKSRQCTKCDTEKSLDNFHLCKTGKHGRKSVCKECRIAEKREYYRKNKQRILEKGADFSRKYMPKGKIRDLTGNRYGNLTVEGYAYLRRISHWMCRCDCGSYCVKSITVLKNGYSLSCGCKRIDENNPRWMGDEVSYSALHKWVKRRLGTPDTCEFCGETGLEGQYIHWANKSGEYKRDLDDWLRLCAICHKNFDYKRNGRQPWNKGKRLKPVPIKRCEFCNIEFEAKYKSQFLCSVACSNRKRADANYHHD